MNNSNVDRRIRPPKEYGAMLKVLTDSEKGVFESNAEVLLFAAAMAFKRGRRKNMENAGEGIRLSVFENLRFGTMIMHTIAFAETKDGNIFQPERWNECATILEEYAHAGLEIMDNEIMRAGDLIQNTIATIQSIKGAPVNSDENTLAGFNLGL